MKRSEFRMTIFCIGKMSGRWDQGCVTPKCIILIKTPKICTAVRESMHIFVDVDEYMHNDR